MESSSKKRDLISPVRYISRKTAEEEEVETRKQMHSKEVGMELNGMTRNGTLTEEKAIRPSGFVFTEGRES